MTKPFGPAGPFLKVYLPIEKVVEGEAEQTVPFGSLFSLTVKDYNNNHYLKKKWL